LNVQEIDGTFLQNFDPVKFNTLVIADLSGYSSKLKIWFLVRILKTYPEDLMMKKVLADELKKAGLKTKSLETYYEIFNKTKNITILIDIVSLLSDLEKFDELSLFIDKVDENLQDYPQISIKLKEIKQKISERA
jgi:hypothetical protein